MFKVSCIQICSGNDIKKNLNFSKKLILKAINKKSDLIVDYFYYCLDELNNLKKF